MMALAGIQQQLQEMKPIEGLMGFLFSICVLSVFLLVGKLMRTKIKLLQKLFLPSSIIAGFVALAMGPYGFKVIPLWILENWKPIPGVLINVVFASLFLGVALPSLKTLWKFGGPQLCYGTIMGVGQYFVAIAVTTLVLVPVFKVPEIFGCILEIGFSGGHGTAAGMKATFDQLGFEAGSALSQMSATVGIIVAVVIGIILINVAIRKGYCACLNEEKGIPTYKKTGLIPEPSRFSIATATVASEAIEPLTFHFGIIAIAMLIGWAMWDFVKGLHPQLAGFPLFPLAMIGGLIVQMVSVPLKIDQYYDRDTFDRILGFSLDMLVLSAIASIRLDLFAANFWPFVIIMVVGIVWVVFCTLVLAPRMFPKYWFERSITEFGMQTGVTAIGLLLLRIVDPLYKTKTATAFGFKQMIYEPFLGGGLITATAPIMITILVSKYGIMGSWLFVIICLAIMLVFFGISWFSGWVNLKPDMKFMDETPD